MSAVMPQGRAGRDPFHIDEMVDAVRSAWLANPELRLGQLIHNAGTKEIADSFYCEDDAMLKALREMR
jgi:hypothetical protein